MRSSEQRLLYSWKHYITKQIWSGAPEQAASSMCATELTGARAELSWWDSHFTFYSENQVWSCLVPAIRMAVHLSTGIQIVIAPHLKSLSSHSDKCPWEKSTWEKGLFYFSSWFQRHTVHHGGGRHGSNQRWDSRSRKLAGHITSVLRKKRVSKKGGWAIKPQGPSPVTHFLQWNTKS